MKTLQKLSVAASVAVLALGVSAGSAPAATLIDTTPAWDGSSFIFPFGLPNTATYGQTFAVGSDNVLDSYSFFVRQDTPDPILFSAYVTEWDGAKATGPILYQSGPQSTSQQNVFQQFNFLTGGVSLSTGSQYVAFINASNFPTSGSGNLGFVFADPEPNGKFVFRNNGTDFSDLTISNWEDFIAGDLAFKASFSPRPVPVPGAVFGVIVAGGALVARQRKNAKAKQTVA